MTERVELHSTEPSGRALCKQNGHEALSGYMSGLFDSETGPAAQGRVQKRI